MEGERALEYRFVIERSAGEEVLRRAADHLAPDVHAPGRPVAYCRTIYVDSADGRFLRTFKSGAAACRARIRQYAAAGDRAGEARILGECGWLEHKRSSGLEREKQRLALAAGDLCALLAGDPIAEPACARLAAVPVLAEVAAGLARGELAPCLLTWYRRWSLGRSPLRVTLDEGITYCLPDAPLVSGARAEPTAVVARDALAVLEVKVAGAMPRWLEREVTDLGRHLAFRHSKFRAGMDALRQAEPASARNKREFARADSSPAVG
jgi:hypothetical protein